MLKRAVHPSEVLKDELEGMGDRAHVVCTPD